MAAQNTDATVSDVSADAAGGLERGPAIDPGAATTGTAEGAHAATEATAGSTHTSDAHAEGAGPGDADTDNAPGTNPGTEADAGSCARVEPPEATHQAEDEVWDTGGEDASHKLDEVEDLGEENERLRAEVERLNAELQAAKDRALRARADYDNLQRRTAAEALEADARSTARVLTRLLDTYEVLGRAVSDAEAAGAEDARAKGLRMALDGFDRVLRDEGLEPVPGAGEPFDHNVHQAVAKEPSEHPEDVVIEVIRPGYLLKGKLLREALVKVSSGTS